MRWSAYGIASLIVSLTLVAMVSCQQESPVEKTGKEITEHAQNAIDKAKGVGETLEDAAQKTAEQAKEAGE